MKGLAMKLRSFRRVINKAERFPWIHNFADRTKLCENYILIIPRPGMLIGEFNAPSAIKKNLDNSRGTFVRGEEFKRGTFKCFNPFRIFVNDWREPSRQLSFSPP